MKIKISDRLILFAGSLLSVAAGVALFLLGLQNKNALYAVLAVVLAAFGGYLIMFLRRYESKRQDFVIQRTDSGELRIATKAIENQVQKCLDLHEEIRARSLKIVSNREGVVVDLTVTLDNNISIPLAVAALQKQIKQYLIASSGIEVKEVRVSVESTQDSLSPQVQELDGEQAAEKAAAKEKKAPMHQRLFGTAEQPAIVPEPPKVEEYGVDEETATEEETEEAAEVEETRDHPAPPPDETEMPLEEKPVEETESPIPNPESETNAETGSLAAPAEESPEESPVFWDMPELDPEERQETAESKNMPQTPVSEGKNNE